MKHVEAFHTEREDRQEETVMKAAQILDLIDVVSSS